MNLSLVLAYVFVILVFFYLFFRRYILDFIIRKQKFSCLRCGSCCRLRVRLTPNEIRHLKAVTKEDFLEYTKGVPYIRRINNYCLFLSLDKGKSRCTIYNDRPNICRDYPKGEILGISTFDHRCRSFKIPKAIESF
jgi:Fe-S-cluster containining protein